MFDAVAFFEEYRRAFARYDARALSQFFHFPSMITAQNGTWVMANREEMEQRFETLFRYYRGRGVVHPTLQSLLPTEMNPWLHQVSTTWGLQDNEGRVVVRFNASYSIRIAEGQEKIIFVVSHNEEDLFQDLDWDRLAAVVGSE